MGKEFLNKLDKWLPILIILGCFIFNHYDRKIYINQMQELGNIYSKSFMTMSNGMTEIKEGVKQINKKLDKMEVK